MNPSAPAPVISSPSSMSTSGTTSPCSTTTTSAGGALGFSTSPGRSGATELGASSGC
jgi:hypothetical protein